jgi:ferredoxin--NADP+ reductase
VQNFEVVATRELAPGVHVLEVEAPRVARKTQPGQFVMVRVCEAGERIPLTIADMAPARGTVTLVVQAIGKTTRLMGRLRAGDTILDVVGPLGTPTHIAAFGTACCVGGGFGIAALHPVARALTAAGNEVISLLGARRADLVLLEDAMRRVSRRVEVATDDGSAGHRGLVTDLLRRLLEAGTGLDRVIAIGPLPMMRAACDVTAERAIPTIVSLNPIMVDGTGMCGACRVRVGGVTRFACVDGPDFDGHQVDFDELATRQEAYRAQERQALERYEAAEMCPSGRIDG